MLGCHLKRTLAVVSCLGLNSHAAEIFSPPPIPRPVVPVYRQPVANTPGFNPCPRPGDYSLKAHLEAIYRQRPSGTHYSPMRPAGYSGSPSSASRYYSSKGPTRTRPLTRREKLIALNKEKAARKREHEQQRRKAEAGKSLEAGREAQASGDSRLARRKYRRAVDLDPKSEFGQKAATLLKELASVAND